MKIRSGFVSNSSSSSFIVGIAIIEDEEKFNKLKEKYSEIEVFDPKTDTLQRWGGIQKEGGRFIIEEPTNYGGYIGVNKTDKKIAYFVEGNNEGDYFFYDDPDSEWPELDYNISFDFFDKNQQNLFTDFNEENGLSNVNKNYGAGRNG